MKPEKPRQGGAQRKRDPRCRRLGGGCKIHGTGVSVFRYVKTFANNRGRRATQFSSGRGDFVAKPRRGLIYKDLGGRVSQ